MHELGMTRTPADLRAPGRVQRRRTSWSPRRIRPTQAGYRHLDAYSPFPIEELAEALGVHRTRLPLVVLLGGIIGGIGGLRAAVLDRR